MAQPMTPDRLIQVLKAEGVTVREYPGWRTAGRDAATGKTFGPVHMVLNHHTAGNGDLDVVAKNGVRNLPAPLAHIWLGRDGVAWLCSARRANHAGLMARNAYDSFLDESATHPKPDEASGTVDGNDVAYGIETENRGDGKQSYPRVQYDAWVRIDAAFCREYGWSAESCGMHKETSVEGKVDPLGPVEGYGSLGKFTFDGTLFRKHVAVRLGKPASWTPEDSYVKTVEQRLVGLETWARTQGYKG